MPSTLTPPSARAHIASGALAPVYLLSGDDEVEKLKIASAFADAIEPDLRAFNVERFYGGEANIDDILDAARTLPLMASRRILIIVRAEKLMEPKRESDASERALESFAQYLREPQPHATLVLIAGSLDGRRKLTRLLLSTAIVIDCSGATGARTPDAWVRERARQAEVRIDQEAVSLLVQRAGADAVRLRDDMERVLTFVSGAKRIQLDDVLEVIGPETHQDEWAITKAIERGAAGPALKALSLALDAGTAPEQILGQLGWFVRDGRNRYPSGRVAHAIEALFRTDLALKASGGDRRVLLERLVVELCEPGARG
jgi:DNA polymerase-3 subunit delta